MISLCSPLAALGKADMSPGRKYCPETKSALTTCGLEEQPLPSNQPGPSKIYIFNERWARKKYLLPGKEGAQICSFSSQLQVGN